MSPKLQIIFLSAVSFLFMSVLVFCLVLLRLKHVKVVFKNLVSASQKTLRHVEGVLVLISRQSRFVLRNA